MDALNALLNSVLVWLRVRTASRAASELEAGKRAAASIEADLAALDKLK